MGFDTLIEQIIVVDDLTIEFRLSEPQASFLANMATDFAVILSAEYAEQLITTDQKELIDQLPIGTGPFKLMNINEIITLDTTPIKIIGMVNLNLNKLSMTLRLITQIVLTKLLTKECRCTWYPSSADVELLKKEKVDRLTWPLV
eukprot:TRINITY_DN31367_c0_g1_i1.p1 TRINITY_DN31367_c0_g1~~TRINITY_DN31367_c0_g1_i1.p1  ORF type:complete len:145 (+),score=16.01 TRINITY_DN31367_c0_g1_i1:115-549(+)